MHHRSTASHRKPTKRLSKKQTPCTFRGKSLNEQLQSQSYLKVRHFAFLRTPRKMDYQIKRSCIASILLPGAQDTIWAVTSRSSAYMDIHSSQTYAVQFFKGHLSSLAILCKLSLPQNFAKCEFKHANYKLYSRNLYQHNPAPALRSGQDFTIILTEIPVISKLPKNVFIWV